MIVVPLWWVFVFVLQFIFQSVFFPWKNIKLIHFKVFLKYFNVLISKIKKKSKTNIIYMYF